MISIITPVYKTNLVQFTRTANSILNQKTKAEFEWVIVEDGLELPPEYFQYIDLSNVKVKRVKLGNNYGPSVARNVGFQVSTGSVITYVDMGDTLFPNRIDVLSLVFFDSEISKNLHVLFSDYIVSQGGLQHKVVFYPESLQYLWKGNISIPMGVAHTRYAFMEAGGFQPGIVCGEDGILWRRMYDILGETVFGVCHAEAGIYYVSENGQSRTQRRFEMGGFAFDAGNSEGSHGQYLDKDWFTKFSSEGYYENS